MTELEPLFAMVGFVGAIAGAGGSYAVTRQSVKDNKDAIHDLESRLLTHEKADDKAFQEIMRSLGRIEGTLQELNRSN